MKMAIRWLAADDHVLAVVRTRKRRGEFSKKRGIDDGDSGPAFFEKPGIIARAQRRARWYRNGAFDPCASAVL